MLRLLLTLGVAALLLVSFSPAAQAITGDDTSDQRKLRGTITAIQPDALSFTLKTMDGKVKIKTNDQTKFRVNGHAAHFGDLTVGQFARVRGKFQHTDQVGHKTFLARRVRAHDHD